MMTGDELVSDLLKNLLDKRVVDEINWAYQSLSALNKGNWDYLSTNLKITCGSLNLEENLFAIESEALSHSFFNFIKTTACKQLNLAMPFGYHAIGHSKKEFENLITGLSQNTQLTHLNLRNNLCCSHQEWRWNKLLNCLNNNLISLQELIIEAEDIQKIPTNSKDKLRQFLSENENFKLTVYNLQRSDIPSLYEHLNVINPIKQIYSPTLFIPKDNSNEPLVTETPTTFTSTSGT